SAGSIKINARDQISILNTSNISSTGNKPSENNNIIANAFEGKGGSINITANRILGFQNQKNLSSQQLKAIENDGISNISAISNVGQNGEASFNTLLIDPSQGLLAQPADLTDPSGLIAQGCSERNGGVAEGQSKFMITGRRGLPPSPDDALSAGAVSANWVNRDTNTLNNNEKNSIKAANVIKFTSGGTRLLVEAVGMVRDRNGDIVLTAKPTTATQIESGLSSTFCSVK
ncbi:MAG: hypothetical protein SAL70_23095, partial [Scytonema sp. PMC 1070.18]|nr:hypothetical protein [Scytonema sp. PMC 1070.18]